LPPETQGALPETMMDFTPELKRRALEQLKAFEAGPIYTPPTVKGTLKVPGSLGGPNWGGAAFDPETGTLFVPTRMTMDLLRARFTDATPGSAPNIPGQAAKMYVDDLPIIKAPYSRVTAIDLNTGDHAWMTPLGNGPRNHPLLKNLNLPPLGDSVLGGAPLVTKSLLFVGVTYTFVTGRALPPPWAKWNDPGFTRKLVYVFDKASGAIVHVLEGDSLSTAAPMTYAHKGKQFLVVASGNGEDSALVAYSLNGVKAE
jgi:quinoprotein glucose dehydrogenase